MNIILMDEYYLTKVDVNFAPDTQSDACDYMYTAFLQIMTHYQSIDIFFFF